MTAKDEIYRCEICGNVVEVIEGYGIPLFCCGEEMKLVQEQVGEFSPRIEEIGENRISVAVKAEFEWVEVLTLNGDRLLRKFIKPGEDTKFTIKKPEFYVRAYGKHGLWKNEIHTTSN